MAGFEVSGSFDCGAHGETVSAFAQDDGFFCGGRRTGNGNGKNNSNGKGKNNSNGNGNGKGKNNSNGKGKSKSKSKNNSKGKNWRVSLYIPTLATI